MLKQASSRPTPDRSMRVRLPRRFRRAALRRHEPLLSHLDDGTKLAGNLDEMPDELRNAPQGGVFRYRRIDEQGLLGSHLAVAIPVALGSDRLLLIGRDIEEQLAFAARIKRTFLWGFGLLSLAALTLGLWVGRSMLKRIESINATTREIMAGDFSQRVPMSGASDEMSELEGNLNAMLERIEQLMAGLREVSDNIAHDLKTPLNRLRNSAEAALRDPRGAAAYREGLEATIERADDLIKTFNALLLIARLEAGVIEESAEEFDAGPLVYDVAELYQPVAEEEGLSLTIDVEDGIPIRANRQLVGQAIANLADNAIKYSAKALSRPTSRPSPSAPAQWAPWRKSRLPITGPALRPKIASARSAALCASKRAAPNQALASGSASSRPWPACTKARSGSKTTSRACASYCCCR